jgi:hypothetical protein
MKKRLFTFLITIGPLFGVSQLPSYLPTDGLIGWWPFNGNANDESGNGYNGTVNGATLAADRTGNANSAYSFDTNQFIQLNNTTNLNPYPLSISLWYKVNVYSAGESSPILFKYVSAAWNGFGIGLNDYNNIPCVYPQYLRGTSNRVFGYYGEPAFDQPNVNIQQWYHYIFTLDASGGKIYVNGNLIASKAWTGTPGATTSSLPIKVGGSYNTWYRGMVDDIAIYNRALTQAEVTALYNGNANNSGGGGSVTTSAPSGISYQAVARNELAQPISESAIQVKFSFLEGSVNGATEYSELHSLTTNALGLFTTTIGDGNAQTGIFENINWATGNKYLKVELDAGNGFIEIGTQQILSVPYAIRSTTSAKSGTIENSNLPVFSDNESAINGGLSIGQMYRTATGDLKVVF